MTINDYDISVIIERQEGIRAEVARNHAAHPYRRPQGIFLGHITGGVDSIFIRLGERALERQAMRARALQKDV